MYAQLFMFTLGLGMRSTAEKIADQCASKHKTLKGFKSVTYISDEAVGEYVWADIDGTGFSGHHPSRYEKYGLEKVFDPDRVYMAEDHFTPASNIEVANEMVKTRQLVKKWNQELS